MAVRPTKTGGNQTYTAEVAGGNVTIKASEVDGDLNAIFTSIDDTNITVASVATNRLRADAGITTGMLGANSVTTAKIADINVTAAKVATNAIGNTKIIAGATATTTADNTNISLVTLTTTTEATLAAQALTFTPRTGAAYFVMPQAIGFADSGTGGGFNISFKLYDDAAVSNLVATWTTSCFLSGTAAKAELCGNRQFLFTGAGTVKQYTLRAVLSGITLGATATFSASNCKMVVLEFA